MPAVTDLQDLALEYLTACAAALDALAPDGAPARQFVSHGTPAWDCCPLLAVHVGVAAVAPTGGIGQAALREGHRTVLTGDLSLITLTATLLRCTVTTNDGAPVEPESLLTAEAADLNADLWAIWNWLQAKKSDGTLFAGTCRELVIENAVALAVDGLCAGWLIPIRVQLDAFASTL